MPQRKRIVIVGGGPIGLLLSFFLMDRYGDRFHVTVIEKRPAYERFQILLLNEQATSRLPAQVRHNIWGTTAPGRSGCYVLSPSRDRLATCYRTPSPDLPFASVITRVLENEMLAHMRRYPHFVFLRPHPFSQGETGESLTVRLDGDRVVVTFPSSSLRRGGNDTVEVPFDVLVGADGVESQVRKEVIRCGTDPLLPVPLDTYGAVLNLVTDPALLRGVRDHADARDRQVSKETEPQFDHRFFRSQVGNYYVGLALNRQEYEIMSNRNQRTLPEPIQDRIRRACQLAGAVCRLPLDLVDWQAFPIRQTVSQKFCGFTTSGRPVYIVGDAAAAPHFFSGFGINAGIEMASSLTDLLARYGGDVPQEVYVEVVRRQVAAMKETCTVVMENLGNASSLVNQ